MRSGSDPRLHASARDRRPIRGLHQRDAQLVIASGDIVPVVVDGPRRSELRPESGCGMIVFGLLDGGGRVGGGPGIDAGLAQDLAIEGDVESSVAAPPRVGGAVQDCSADRCPAGTGGRSHRAGRRLLIPDASEKSERSSTGRV